MQTCTHAHMQIHTHPTGPCESVCMERAYAREELVVERSSKLSQKRINYGQSCTHTPTIKVHIYSPSHVLPAKGAKGPPWSSPKIRTPKACRAYRHLGASWCQTNLWTQDYFLVSCFPPNNTWENNGVKRCRRLRRTPRTTIWMEESCRSRMRAFLRRRYVKCIAFFSRSGSSMVCLWRSGRQYWPAHT